MESTTSYSHGPSYRVSNQFRDNDQVLSSMYSCDYGLTPAPITLHRATEPAGFSPFITQTFMYQAPVPPPSQQQYVPPPLPPQPLPMLTTYSSSQGQLCYPPSYPNQTQSYNNGQSQFLNVHQNQNASKQVVAFPPRFPLPPNTNPASASAGSSPSSLYFPPQQFQTQPQQQQQQQQQHNQYPRQNRQFPYNPQLLHQRQLQLQPIERRWWLWAIGIVDIIAVVYATSLVLRDVFLKPISDPDSFIWHFFLSSLTILARFVMGFGLIIGLHTSDDPSTLWYCKMWVWCQYFVLIFLLPELFTSVGNIMSTPSNLVWEKNLPPKLFIVLAVMTYRVFSYILIKKFISRLEKCESVFLDRVYQRQMQEDRERRRSQDQGAGETSFCGPSIALIMSL